MRTLAAIAFLLAVGAPRPREAAIVPAPVIACPGGGHIRCSGNRSAAADRTVTGTMTCQLGDPASNTDDCTLAGGQILTGTVDVVWSGVVGALSVTATGTVKRWTRGSSGGLEIAGTDCSISLRKLASSALATGTACGVQYTGPAPVAGNNGGGACTGGQLGSARSCVQNGISGPCDCNTTITSMCITPSFWAQSYGGQFPAACTKQGGSCVAADGRTVNAYCCEGLSCNLGGGNACGAGALTCQKIP